MAIYIRNVESNGAWVQGGTYTFEWYKDNEDFTETLVDGSFCAPPPCGLCLRYDITGWSRAIYEDDDNYFLFNNGSLDGTGGVSYLTQFGEDAPLDGQDAGEPGWYRRTVSVHIATPATTYYLKHYSFQTSTPFYVCVEAG